MDKLPLNVLEKMHDAISEGVRTVFKEKKKTVIEKSAPKHWTSFSFTLEEEPQNGDQREIRDSIMGSLRTIGCHVENTYARGVVASLKDVTISLAPSKRQNGQKVAFQVVIGIHNTTLSVNLLPYDGH